MAVNITDIVTHDIRFPTSRQFGVSDAMYAGPDYSAAYVILKTDRNDGLEGHGLSFTMGRGNDICISAIEALRSYVVGRTLESIIEDMGAFWRAITSDQQLRWLGPEKGIIHMAVAVIVNAVWDLYAKVEKKPLWKLLTDMDPEDIVRCIDFRYITDVLTPDEALATLRKNKSTQTAREQELMENGYPAYITSVGWLSYSDNKIRDCCQQAKNGGWTNFKMKIGSDVTEDIRRAHIVREVIGWDCRLMMDANQVWGVNEAITNIKKLSELQPFWVEEPISPDDVLGHAAIARAVRPVSIATGENCQNRVLAKQFMQANAVDFFQMDACRLGGVNEALSVLLMAEKFNIPICPHAGGVGLCEYAQHLAYFDYICVSGSLENRVVEYVDYLHEHFIEPVRMKNGRYMPPLEPGYSIAMKPETFEEFEFPCGAAWKE